MKIIIALTMMLIFSTTSYNQNSDPSNQLTREDYLKKSITQKIIGFVMLGAGAISFISLSKGKTDSGTAGKFVVVGSVAILGSIPLFIAAGKNKR